MFRLPIAAAGVVLGLLATRGFVALISSLQSSAVQLPFEESNGTATITSGIPLPEYVLAYAPLSYLHSSEAYWPSDVGRHLRHVVPKDGHQIVAPSVTYGNVSNLDSNIFLSSKDSPYASPQAAWFAGEGPPDAKGRARAPATIIAVRKPGGILDAFYFYFYSYNHMHWADITIGDHFGDWENTLVRFVNGKPQTLYLSQHGRGVAYNFSSIPVVDGRPLTYIAAGTHATYASPGKYQHDFPGLYDLTDDGFLWDVTKNFRGYWFDANEHTFAVAGGTAMDKDEISRDVRWLEFEGRWGDKEYRWFENGQYCFAIPWITRACKLMDGPTGPVGKNLARTTVCQDDATCVFRDSV